MSQKPRKMNSGLKTILLRLWRGSKSLISFERQALIGCGFRQNVLTIICHFLASKKSELIRVISNQRQERLNFCQKLKILHFSRATAQPFLNQLYSNYIKRQVLIKAIIKTQFQVEFLEKVAHKRPKNLKNRTFSRFSTYGGRTINLIEQRTFIPPVGMGS